MTKKEQQYEEKIAGLEQRIKDLEESRENTLESCREALKKNRMAREEAEAGAKQIRSMVNSIIIYLIQDKGGELRLPRGIFHEEDDRTYQAHLDGEEYVMTLGGNDE